MACVGMGFSISNAWLLVSGALKQANEANERLGVSDTDEGFNVSRTYLLTSSVLFIVTVASIQSEIDSGNLRIPGLLTLQHSLRALSHTPTSTPWQCAILI